ncbi:MAG: hypothetical protein A2X46_17870 [Lentisphaerae bacterium GWF2_57_35]|nr:MAG: hypothetical protein A2X46_17870 [Lentisphaerae bacterium GWF2_57_35]
MLINFRFGNYLSFRDEVEFTCLASREKQHAERVFRSPRLKFRILPLATIWGANGSGKSNFYYAIQFARRFIVRGKSRPEDRIDVEPFKLDPAYLALPTSFGFDLLINDHIYSYQFSVTRERVVSESLDEVKGEKRTRIYSRGWTDSGTPVWDIEYFRKLDMSEDDKQFIEFKTRDTLPNQLFLSELRGKKIPILDNVGEWFRRNLVLLDPNAVFKPIELSLQQVEEFRRYAADLLQKAGTGIYSLENEMVAIESLPLSEPQKAEITKMLSASGDKAMFQVEGPERRRFLVFREGNETKAMKLVANHNDCNARRVAFEMTDESEGTQRLIDLLSAFYELSNPTTEKVFVIDELDRSLHTLLTRSLVESFLSVRQSSSRGQLIFTTHDGLLLDQNLMRRDEVWFIDKNAQGASALSSLSDFDVRYDKDIRKSYLQGRFGGIPNIWGLPKQALNAKKED